jgi:hypothetical protein
MLAVATTDDGLSESFSTSQRLDRSMSLFNSKSTQLSCSYLSLGTSVWTQGLVVVMAVHLQESGSLRWGTRFDGRSHPQLATPQFPVGLQSTSWGSAAVNGSDGALADQL